MDLKYFKKTEENAHSKNKIVLQLSFEFSKYDIWSGIF